jgi:hypothetical protein
MKQRKRIGMDVYLNEAPVCQAPSGLDLYLQKSDGAKLFPDCEVMVTAIHKSTR